MALVRVYCGLAAAEVASWLTAAVVDDAGRLLEVRDISDDPVGYAQLAALLAERSHGGAPVAVAADRATHLVSQLLSAANRWLCIADDELAVDDYAERFADDESPEEMESPAAERRAVGLARALQAGAVSIGNHRPNHDLDVLKPVLAAHTAVIGGRHNAAVALREVLRELYPAALRAFPDPAELVPLAVLGRLPEPGLLSNSSQSRNRDAAVIGEIATAESTDPGIVASAVTALRVAVAESSPRRTAPSRQMAPVVAETVRQCVTAVRAFDRSAMTLVGTLVDRLGATGTPTLVPRSVPTPDEAPANRVPSPRRRGAAAPTSTVVPLSAAGAPGGTSPAIPMPAAPMPAIPMPAIPMPAAPMPAAHMPAAPVTAVPVPSAPPAPTPLPVRPAAARSAPAASLGPSPVGPAPAGPVSGVPAAASPYGEPARYATPGHSTPGHSTPGHAAHGYEPAAYSGSNGRYDPPNRYESLAGGFEPPRGHEVTPDASPLGARRYDPPNGYEAAPQPGPPPRRGFTPPAEPAPWQEPSVDYTRLPDPAPAPGVPAPGSRSDWPLVPRTDDDMAVRQPAAYAGPADAYRDDREPVSLTFDVDQFGGFEDSGWRDDRHDSRRAPHPADDRIPPPWLADDMLNEPPVLRLVDAPDYGETAPAVDPLTDPLHVEDTGEMRFGPPQLRVVDSVGSRAAAARSRHGSQERLAPINGAPAVAEADGDLLIFAQTRSAWFTHLDEDEPREADQLAWASVADEGWRAAEQAARPAVGDETMAGLPKRVPQANLVPGSAASQPRPLRIVRDAASIAEHTTGYFRGWRRGQEVGGFAVGQRDRGAWDFNREQRSREVRDHADQRTRRP